MNQYLTFVLDDRLFGVAVAHINSVLDPQAITPLPHENSIVTGLTNVRGNVVPVFDPREVLARTKIDDRTVEAAPGQEEDEKEDGIIIFEIENATLLPFIGIKADRIGKVLNLPEDQLAPVPEFLPDTARRYLEGFYMIGDTRLNVLNLRSITSKDTLFAIEGGARA